ncbi:cyclic nucleotide-binding protein [Lysinibacillus sp. 2017]|uniref:Crp/Fnr family transcriptional regulator n=1 Tax=unclassified Lysinibacillus TaxID=2636778 RepID=UPI000D52A13E|nr:MULTISPECIES: Crp/Fnr family transcriptional regulator [unclassified Lysinibacillus]AWE08813.1 cyclic nucleotide-binding protein [Lysinibacillus sp. 2017]TGN36135.1 Crp/Fnr family transcriptional regulator [Lysinibacillus sp. S2017]
MKDILLKYMSDFTLMSEDEQRAIYESLRIDEYKKGQYLLRQGELSAIKCYFVLMGCVRQFFIDESGKEVTSNFFTEDQAIPIINEKTQDDLSKYSFVCVEDCILVVGDVDSENTMFNKYPQLEIMVRKMMEINIGEIQEQFGQFIGSSPEERYESVLRKRPELIDRVPQHQLASYLGITPESLSRIKKRIKKNKL